MFDLDNLSEIWYTIKKNKLRSFLTALSITWGIFMIIVLLGSGNGLENGMKENFKGEAMNAFWVFSGYTTMPFAGQQQYRAVQLEDDDDAYIRNKVRQVSELSSSLEINSYLPVSSKFSYGTFSITASQPDNKIVEKHRMLQGRFINRLDETETRMTSVIGDEVRKVLFPKTNPLGKFIQINKVSFKVVGVFDDDNKDDKKTIYIPLSTGQKIFRHGKKVNNIAFTLSDTTPEESKKVEKELKSGLAFKHQYNPKDESALYIFNSIDEFSRTMKMFKAIRLFLWIIGIGTIIAGAVGISNIMLIVVKERTKEIGVRKALGATPASVINLILSEAVIITCVAGLIGLLLGTGIMEIVHSINEANIANEVVSSADEKFVLFKNPTVDFSLALQSAAVLVLSGLLAGFFPAKKAAEIKPIVALRDE
ncbi:MAG: ABC transporter permease [Rhodothermaceae bacterium]